MTPLEIIALVDAFVVLAERIPSAIEALKQNAEMTDEQRAALDERIAKLKSLPHWKV